MTHYVGIDVSKATLEVAEECSGKSKQYSNSPDGRSELARTLRAHDGQLHVVVEPTSTYHQHVVDALMDEGISFSLINPSRSKAFSRLVGRRAKTDKVDARLLMELGKSQHLMSSHVPDRDQERLKSLRRYLGQLEEDRTALNNRLEAFGDSPWTSPAVIESLRRRLNDLEREIDHLRDDLDKMVSDTPNWRRSVELLETIPGIGRSSAVLIVSELPAVQHCASAKVWVAYCGVNPEPRESGNTHYSKLSRMGMARVRASLYMPAVSALRWNAPIKALGERLQAKGKTGKLRVMAAMNKLLRQCFGVLRTGTPFDPVLNQRTSP